MLTQEIVSVFAKGGFAPRVKGQRREQDLLPTFVAPDGSVSFPLPGQPVGPLGVQELGTFVAAWGSSRAPRQVTAWSITLPCGLCVPAYSFGGEFNICQVGSFRAYRP